MNNAMKSRAMARRAVGYVPAPAATNSVPTPIAPKPVPALSPKPPIAVNPIAPAVVRPSHEMTETATVAAPSFPMEDDLDLPAQNGEAKVEAPKYKKKEKQGS